MIQTLDFFVGDLCQIKENQGHDRRIREDEGKDYIIVGFLLHAKTTYVLIYGTNIGGHNGNFDYSPLVDQYNNPMSIDRIVYSEEKFTFIEIDKISKAKDVLKLSNGKIKAITKC